MNRIALSPAASALLRALIGRAGVERDRILLTGIQSTEWCSLTFTGERHVIELRITGSHSEDVTRRMCDGLEDAEFSIPGILVADICPAGAPVRGRDGSTTVAIEALTVHDMPSQAAQGHPWRHRAENVERGSFLLDHGASAQVTHPP